VAQLHRARNITFLLSNIADRANSSVYYICGRHSHSFPVSGSTSKTDTKILSDLHCDLKSKLGRDHVSVEVVPVLGGDYPDSQKRRDLVIGTHESRLLDRTSGGYRSIASRGDRQDECRRRSPLLEVELMSGTFLL
jgi:hypothetical protein